MTQPTRSFVVPTVVGRLHVQDSGPAGDAVALLWPSLFTDGPTSWGAQLTGLHDVGWRTLVIDPPGTGASPPPPGLFTMEECAEAALQTRDAADAQRAALLGLSWGGFVALRVALAAPKRVTGLVLSNTSARRMSFIRRQRDRLVSMLIDLGVPGGPGRLVVPGLVGEQFRRQDPGFTAHLADGINNLDTTGLARAVRSCLAERTSVVEALDQITAPTLIIAGAEDKALPPTHSVELAERIAGAQLEVLPRVGHLAPREAPGAVTALLQQFLAPLSQ
ncbi:alpha/beta hydrolase [Mycobacterium sp.]|uniref:alpha/beta fold hydrolase n=1 Tax=Mycobacterium sp. TaxID=1785 RepID=UPI002D261A4B|nr:alpha/beta hydrolase [Mycobacterium sp.]HZA12551.1 alpha/beta hydrolase [Mycobacterium sp.]